MNSNIEHELVEQFRAGNEIAFELIFHKTKGKLKGFLLKVLPIGEDAESILHEIYLKLWSNRKAIKTDKNFETYLFAIARNLVVEVMRKRFQRHKLTPDAKWKDWETLVEWPDWFNKGEQSPTGRYSFTTARHYQIDSPLMPSGLLGPVKIMSGK